MTSVADGLDSLPALGEQALHEKQQRRLSHHAVDHGSVRPALPNSEAVEASMEATGGRTPQ